MFASKDNRLVYTYDAEQLWIEPWGQNAIRVRATKMHTMPQEDWALLQQPNITAKIDIASNDESATLTNGLVKATITKRGKITISNTSGKVLLEEYARTAATSSIPNAAL